MPSSGLSYNLRVGTTPGGSDVVGPMAFNPTGGLRKIAQRGLIQGTSWTLEGLVPSQTYYWSVQAIDTVLAGSAFAGESQFILEFDTDGVPAAVEDGALPPVAEVGLCHRPVQRLHDDVLRR